MKPSPQRLAQRKLAGGTDFSVYQPGKDARQAFRSAVEDAQHERGHGGYSGSIAEKSGYTIRSQTPMSGEEASAFIDKDIDRNDKWDPAFAIPIASSKTVAEKDIVVKVKARNRDDAVDQAKALVKSKVKLRAGAKLVMIVGYSGVKEMKSGGLPTIEKNKPSSKVVFVINHGGPDRPGQGFGQVYGSKVEATKALKDYLSRPDVREGQTFTIFKRQATDVIKVTKLGSKLPVWEVTVKAKQIKVGAIEGWTFYGVASS